MSRSGLITSSCPLICPIFYVETLGNLAKEPTKRGPPEVIVRDIANKFPEWGGSPCGFHTDLAINDLLGNHIELRYQIPRPGGRPVKSGTVFDQTPEEEAFHRWHKGEFYEVERLVAAVWRKALGELDLIAVGKEMRTLGLTQKACKTLQDAKAIADALVNGTDKPYARLALAAQFFNIPATPTSADRAGVAECWQADAAGVRSVRGLCAHCRNLFPSCFGRWVDWRRTTFESDGYRISVLPAVLDGICVVG